MDLMKAISVMMILEMYKNNKPFLEPRMHMGVLVG